jgi:hypothetical protein
MCVRIPFCHSHIPSAFHYIVAEQWPVDTEKEMNVTAHLTQRAELKGRFRGVTMTWLQSPDLGMGTLTGIPPRLEEALKQ